MAMEKRIKFKHGVSELGNLKVYPIIEILEDGKAISTKREQAYTPSDVNNMTGFDQKSIELVSIITDKDLKTSFKAEQQAKTGIGIEKIITYDRMVEENGAVSVRKITRIFDEGKEVSKKYHRSWIMPGDNPDNNDVISKALAKKLHTKEVIDKFKAKQVEQQI